MEQRGDTAVGEELGDHDDHLVAPGRLTPHRVGQRRAARVVDVERQPRQLREVWGPEYGTETQYLGVYASQLRKKLGDDPARPHLVTEAGVGYRLVDPTDAA